MVTEDSPDKIVDVTELMFRANVQNVLLNTLSAEDLADVQMIKGSV